MEHGISIQELSTALTPPVEVEAPIVCVGSAAIHLASKPARANEPILITSMTDYVEQFGWSGDFNSYTNEEAASAAFSLFNVAPVVFINVLDETKSTNGTKTLSGLSNPVEIDEPILLNTIKITSGSGSSAVTLTADEYTAQYDGSTCVITITDDDRIVDDSAVMTYKKITPSAVTTNDIISALEKVEDVYPKLGMIPGGLIAPKYSSTPAVAQVMANKAKNINECFNSLAFADIDAAQVTTYSAAYAYKNQTGLNDARLVLCWPKVILNNVQYHLSTQLAALCCQVDAGNDGLPYESPSNKFLVIDGSVLADGSPVYLSKPQANTLNEGGIVTALNFVGQRAFGNRTSIYPSSADVKDCFISVRRMFNYIGNTLVTTFFSRIDSPISKRLVQSVVDSAQIFLNGLTASGAILGGRIAFLDELNPATNLLAGKITFSLYIAPPVPSETITFQLTYDTSYFATLFA